jgi:hypothetical protein
MEKKDVFTKVLAVAGTVLVWIPILFAIITAVIGTIRDRVLRFDFLMPAELFPVALVGVLLLLWAAQRARSQRKLIRWGLVAMVVFLFGGQAIAIVSGLASGAVEPTGWPWALAISSIALYTLALIEVCIAGVLLVREV